MSTMRRSAGSVRQKSLLPEASISAMIAPVEKKPHRIEIKVVKEKVKPPPPEPIPEEEIEVEIIPQRVFLYLKTVTIDHIPGLIENHDVVLRMKQGNNKITKVDEHYTDETDANLSTDPTELPVYSITINQDSIDDLNLMCDTPLAITLYEHILTGQDIIKSRFSFDSMNSEQKFEVEAEDEGLGTATEDLWIPLAQGNLDLLQFFSQNKSSALNSIFLYPITMSKFPIAVPTCKLTMQITSVLPLFKDFAFCNTAFITFESIYNANQEIMDGELMDFMVDLSFQSKTKLTDKVKLCSFSMFSKDIISAQNVKHKWENMKDLDVNSSSLGVYSGLSLSLHKLFVGLLGTNGVDFKFDEILQDEEYALVCNSVHRYALTKELSAILENAIAFNEQQILIELYKENEPTKILLEGICELAVFSYPKVNACRFAVELKPPAVKRKSKGRLSTIRKDNLNTDRPNKILKKGKGKPTPRQSDTSHQTSLKKENSNTERLSRISLKTSKGTSGTSARQSAQPKKTTFAIINICLLAPITAVPHIISNCWNKKETLQTCKAIKSEAKIVLQTELRKDEFYKEMDEVAYKLMDYIVKNNIKLPLDAKEFLCCQLGNLVNKIIKVISCDFNIRIPTKTNIEFVNLITTVYKELEQRWYDIIQSCNNNELDECFAYSEEKHWKILKAMDMAKLTLEAGREELGNFIFEKILKKNPGNEELNFYIFVFNMEKLDYEAAKVYFDMPVKEKLTGSEYHTEIVKIYIDYIQQQQEEETAENAFEELLSAVKGFIDKYPKEIDFWILLHCLYTNCNYLPGMEFTRWKYENLYKLPRKTLPTLPKSRWSINNNYKLTVTTPKSLKFYEVIETFLNLGLYQFAEIVFSQISDECFGFEKTFMKNTFAIFQNNSEKHARTFPAEKLSQGDDVKAYQAMINGNLELYMENIVAAMKNYEKLLDLKLNPYYEDYQLGLLRLGFHMLEIEQKYHMAEKAFKKCVAIGLSCMLADFGLGKTLYKLGRLEEALENFANATRYEMHIPDTWGYLALINLKLGENFKALECWKYAKLDPKNIISDEILEELSAIDISDVILYVDVPEDPGDKLL